MTRKIMPLPDAVARFVKDGQTIAMEGFTHLIPFAAGHEVIRQARRELTLVRMTPDIIYDQLIGMGCAKSLVFSWGGNPGVGSIHRFRDAIENGWPRPLAIQEHSHAEQTASSFSEPPSHHRLRESVRQLYLRAKLMSPSRPVPTRPRS